MFRILQKGDDDLRNGTGSVPAESYNFRNGTVFRILQECDDNLRNGTGSDFYRNRIISGTELCSGFYKNVMIIYGTEWVAFRRNRIISGTERCSGLYKNKRQKRQVYNYV